MTAAARLHPLRSGSIKMQVVDAVRNAILTGRLPPGEPLRELHLARELRVSQATVREALLELERANLVVRTPGKGTSVIRMSDQEAGERLALRAVLETMAAIAAARRMNEQDFSELRRKLEAIAEAASRASHYEVGGADLCFHRYIWEQSGNATLCRVLEQVTAPFFAFVSIARALSPGKLEGVVGTHEPILQALRAGDPLAVRRAVRDHILLYDGELPDARLEDLRPLLDILP